MAESLRPCSESRARAYTNFKDVISVTRLRFVLLLLLILFAGACLLAWPNLFAERSLEGVVTGQAQARRSVSIVCVGDVMLDRTVWKRIQANGPGSIFAHVMDDLRAGDIIFANLECPLADSGPHNPHACIFRAPTRAVAVLQTVPFSIVSLANNHAYDAGRKGLETTMAVLEKAGIAYIGASRDGTSPPPPVFFDINGLKVGFLGYTALSFVYRSDAKVTDIAALKRQIADAKREADLLLVSYHWGDEYHRTPNKRQRLIAHATIDAGADVVLGHHPHVLEGIEVYKHGLILYSMGNFVFDQRPGERMETAVFTIAYTEGRGLQVTARPMWIPLKTCAPQPPDGARQSAIIERLKKMSAELGTALHTNDGTVFVNVSHRNNTDHDHAIERSCNHEIQSP